MRRAVSFLIAIGAALGGCSLPGMDAETAGRRAARRAYERGLGAAYQLRYGEAFEAYRESLRSDPTWLPALAEMVVRFDGTTSPLFAASFLDSLSTQVADRPLAACYARWSKLMRGIAPAPPGEHGMTQAARECALLQRLTTSTAGSVDSAPIRGLWRTYGGPLLLDAHLGVLGAAGAWHAVLDEARAVRRRRDHPLVAALAGVHEAIALHSLDRHAEAVATEARALSAVDTADVAAAPK
jgi:hypothetical protein